MEKVYHVHEVILRLFLHNTEDSQKQPKHQQQYNTIEEVTCKYAANPQRKTQEFLTYSHRAHFCSTEIPQDPGPAQTSHYKNK